MKNAYDIAMARFGGGPLERLSDDQKARIAEVESLYKSKRAQAELSVRDRLAKAAGDPAAEKQVREDLAVELASIESKLESEKEKIRSERT